MSDSVQTPPALHLLPRKLAQTLRRRCGVAEGAHIFVAASGGPDSTALLRGLADLAPRRGLRLSLTVGHVHHHLREDADADATFVEDLARKLNLPYLRADLDLSQRRGNLENQARDGRYAALARLAADAGASFVATAHHGDDQLETMLMRMLRGTSVQGLSGMPWSRRLPGDGDLSLIRPMLGVGRRAIMRYLTEIAQVFCEDATNADTTRLRSRLRAQVLPVLHEVDEHADQRAVRLADDLRQMSRLLEQLTDQAQLRVESDAQQTSLDRPTARKLSPIVLSSLLRRLLVERGAGADGLGRRSLAPIVRAVRDKVGGARRFALKPGIQIEVNAEKVTLGREEPPQTTQSIQTDRIES